MTVSVASAGAEPVIVPAPRSEPATAVSSAASLTVLVWLSAARVTLATLSVSVVVDRSPSPSLTV